MFLNDALLPLNDNKNIDNDDRHSKAVIGSIDSTKPAVIS